MSLSDCYFYELTRNDWCKTVGIDSSNENYVDIICKDNYIFKKDTTYKLTIDLYIARYDREVDGTTHNCTWLNDHEVQAQFSNAAAQSVEAVHGLSPEPVLAPTKPTTTTSYVLSSYANGTGTETYNALTAGSVITYTITPNSGYYIKSASVYRFSGTSLSTIDFTKGTKIHDFTNDDITNGNFKYTITNDDIGNCLCLYVDFEAKPVVKFTGKITTTNCTYTLNKQTLVITPSDKTKTIDNVDIEATPYAGASTEPITATKQNDGTYIATINSGYCNDNDVTIDITVNYKLTLADMDITFNLTNATHTVKDNLITLTANKGYLLTNATLNIKSEHDFGSGNDYSFTISKDKKTATYDGNNTTIDSTNTYTVTNTTEVDKSTLGLKDKVTTKNTEYQTYFSHANYSVSGNTITVTINNNFTLVSAKVTADNYVGGIETDNYSEPMNISKDGKTATLTIDSATIAKFDKFYVFDTVKQTSDNPKTGKYTGTVTLSKNISDILTSKYDNLHIFTLTVPNNYKINSLTATAQIEVDGGHSENLNSAIKLINAQTATLTVPIDDFNDIDILIDGDISKIELPSGTVTADNITYVYSLNDNNLKDLTDKAVEFYRGGSINDYDFTQFINQLYMLPFKLPNDLGTSCSTITTGWFAVNTNAIKLNTKEYTLDIGSITVKGLNGNGFDYKTANISLILPFTNAINLNVQDVINHTLHIKYIVNLTTGKTNVIIDNELTNLMSYQTNIVNNIQLFSIYENKDFGQLNSTLENNIRQAYLKIDYYKPVNNLIAYDCNEHGSLGNYKGYVQVKNVLLNGQYTYNNMVEITNLLKAGVYID